LSNAKIQRNIFLEDALAMIFIDFGLLRSPYCEISYSLRNCARQCHLDFPFWKAFSFYWL